MSNPRLKTEDPRLFESPSSQGYAMPAEWAPHEATWLSWPQNEETWPGPQLKAVEKVYVQMIEALLDHEKVHLLVKDERREQEVRKFLGDAKINLKNLLVHQASTVDSWIRDYGPTFVLQTTDYRLQTTVPKSKTAVSSKAYIKWIFNAWGGKYESFLADDKIFRDPKLVQHNRFEANMVLEGGSIEVNGVGTCMTSRQCLLNPNRNPQMSQQQIEKALCDYLGVSNILWLEDGIAGDDTDGHIDDIARFVNTNTIAACVEEDSRDENYPALKKNWEILKNSCDQNGKKWNLIALPMPGKVTDGRTRLPASYANFYVANDVVILPVFRHAHDEKAIRILREVFSGRTVVPIPCNELVQGLGGIHCVSQQEPSAS